MDVIIREVDAGAYEELCARAVLEGREVGELIGEAILWYLARPTPGESSFAYAKAIEFPPGNENLSSEIDSIVYGDDR